MTPHAVISGAGIAGPALADQLTARGWRTTVIERFPQRRDEGQNVDIRGAARDVVRRMGIEDEVRAANTGEIGTRFVTADGTVRAAFPLTQNGETDGPTAELEILRGELSRILVERTQTVTDYRFGVQITDIRDDGEKVAVVLDDGTAVDADIVVLAEGLRSRSRRFVTTDPIDELGMYFAYATLPRGPGDDKWWNWQHASKSRGVHLRPDNLGTTRAILTFITDVRGLDNLQPADQIAILHDTFADVGGAAPRVLREIADGAPMYFAAVGQFRNTVWSKGRIALLGDAAFCNATFGGAGTSLALIGAYVLAGELAIGADVQTSLARYQRRMQPFVATAPAVREGMLRLANPRSPVAIGVVHTCARIAAGPLGRAVSLLGRGLGGIGGKSVDLPRYPEAARDR